MTETNGSEEKFDEIAAHKHFAGGLYNLCWELMEKGEDRTEEEDEEMLLAAQGSAYHWRHLKGHVEDWRWAQSPAISHDQISMVYEILGNGEMALAHAKKSLEWCEKNGVRDFPITWAHIRFANAYNLLGEIEKRNEHMRIAQELIGDIKDERDRNYTLSELKKVKGYDEVIGDA